MKNEKELTKNEISLEEFEIIMSQFNEENTLKNITQIVFDPKNYGLMTTELDDYFSLCVRSKSLELIQEMIEFLNKNNFTVLGSIDDFGMRIIEERFADIGKEIIKYLRSASGKEIEKQKPFDVNENKEYYVFFMPFNYEFETLEKSENIILTKALGLSKKYDEEVLFLPNQLDNTVTGFKKITPKDQKIEPMNFVLLTDTQDVRHAYITFCCLNKIGSREYIKKHSKIYYLDEYVDCGFNPISFNK